MTAVFRVRELDPGLLASERDRVLQLLRPLVPVARVAEVGSTAVEGVIGKQDIDIAMSVPAGRFAAVRAIMDRQFPRDGEQFSSDSYQAYTIPSEIDVSVQLFVEGSEYDRFVDFVGALKADRSLVTAYNALKREWNGRSMAGYREAKARFIADALDGKLSSGGAR